MARTKSSAGVALLTGAVMSPIATVKANANEVSDIKPARAVIDGVGLKKLDALK